VLRGAGLAQLWPSVAAMLLLGVALLGIASFRFSQRTA